jgi:DNA polymerase
MLTAIQLTWEDICIYPIVKSTPASNKEPSEDEVQSGLPSLLREIEILKPKVICAMGKISSQSLLKTSKQLFALRGKFYTLLNIPLMPTFHPALLLKHPELKKASWQDLQSIRQKIDNVS